jgi:hypothetical protein
MVIITIIIAKIYFPKSLKRGEPTSPRPFSYRRKAYKDIAANAPVSEEGEAEELYSLEDEDDKLDADFQGGEGDDELEGLFQEISSSDEESSSIFASGNILEFDQEQTSRTQVLKRLLFCSLMLNITFVTWGALQERMLTRKYPRHTGDYFTYSYYLVFSNRFLTMLMSGMLLLWLKPKASRTTILYEYSFPSISNMLSSWCQYEALRYVSFPATTLFKSFKLAPVMLMGKLLGNKSCKYLI